MPEGHSIHRLARQFQDVFAGQRLSVSSPQGRFASGAALLDGQVLLHADAHGKQLFLGFDNELVLRVHLGLYGAWDFGGDKTFAGASSIGAPRRIGEREIQRARTGTPGEIGIEPGSTTDPEGYAGPPEPKGAVRVRLVSGHGWADLRGPTACEVLTPAQVATAIGKLGPDPLHNCPGDAAAFSRRAGASRTAVALLLMNQQVLAGVGNVYRAEVLFRQRLNPWLPGSALSAQRLAALWLDLVLLMRDGVRDGRIITTLPADRASPAIPVPVGEAHYVYKREGLPCRICGTEIALIELGNRKLYWCPQCQASGPGA
ncbi:Fpg/Nei family DNA glycosylase [Paeniglutamicibacter antarcticus]|uniref:DNA-(apurinic or apyrimidinic site) lyase n=1 Tax=Arthrobacter terrae TaxID=2935737 RepID=A0A931CRM7_9MICC|nr:DNA glycosylase [Arthrobacter terrae]MBG0740931.1 Fpg/Nei family DNA glycosylase [Arthrobacter terrae]